MSKSTDLVRATPTEMVKAEPMPVATMLQAIIEKGVTAESVAVAKELMQLHVQLETRNAERAFAEAFAALQRDMPKVQATKAVVVNGVTRYTYAPFEDIMAQVGPLLRQHGFTISFSTDYQAGPPERLVKSCTLQHVSGHKQTNSFAVRVGSTRGGNSEAQTDGGASTFAKRYALMDALNIVTGLEDDDARVDGDYITELQARRLEERCEQLGVDTKKFLAYAQADSFETIRVSRLEVLVKQLDKKADEKVPY